MKRHDVSTCKETHGFPQFPYQICWGGGSLHVETSCLLFSHCNTLQHCRGCRGSVLQCVVVCCSVLQCVAVCCNVKIDNLCEKTGCLHMQRNPSCLFTWVVYFHIATHCNTLQHTTVSTCKETHADLIRKLYSEKRNSYAKRL